LRRFHAILVGTLSDSTIGYQVFIRCICFKSRRTWYLTYCSLYWFKYTIDFKSVTWLQTIVTFPSITNWWTYVISIFITSIWIHSYQRFSSISVTIHRLIFFKSVGRSQSLIRSSSRRHLLFNWWYMSRIAWTSQITLACHFVHRFRAKVCAWRYCIRLS